MTKTEARPDYPTHLGPGWDLIDGAPKTQAVRLYWPRMVVDDDGEVTTTESDSFGTAGCAAYVGGWPPARPSAVDLASGYLLDWVYGPPTFWRPL